MEALKSPSWLLVSLETMEEVMQSDNICFDELGLYLAVVEWGKAQALEDDLDSEPDYSVVRSKVFSLLKFIRFSKIDYKKFAAMCIDDKVLSTEEKLQILTCLSLDSLQFMPKEFCGATQSARNFPVVITLPYTSSPNQQRGYNEQQNTTFNFIVDKKVRLIGLQVHQACEGDLKNVVMELCDVGGAILSGIIQTGFDFAFEEKKYVGVDMDANFVLRQNVLYSLKFTRPAGVYATTMFTLRGSSFVKGNLLSVKLKSQSTTVPLTALVFQLV